VQRQNEGAAPFQGGLRAADFRHAGEEGQNIAVMLGQSGAHRSGHRIRQLARYGDVGFRVLDGDGEHPAETFDDLGVHQAGEAGAVGGG